MYTIRYSIMMLVAVIACFASFILGLTVSTSQKETTFLNTLLTAFAMISFWGSIGVAYYIHKRSQYGYLHKHVPPGSNADDTFISYGSTAKERGPGYYTIYEFLEDEIKLTQIKVRSNGSEVNKVSQTLPYSKVSHVSVGTAKLSGHVNIELTADDLERDPSHDTLEWAYNSSIKRCREQLLITAKKYDVNVLYKKYSSSETHTMYFIASICFTALLALVTYYLRK